MKITLNRLNVAILLLGLTPFLAFAMERKQTIDLNTDYSLRMPSCMQLTSVACKKICNLLLYSDKHKNKLLAQMNGALPIEIMEMLKRELIYSHMNCFWDYCCENIAKQTLVFHNGRINAIAISPDSSFVVTAGSDNLGCIWYDEHSIPLIGHKAQVNDVVISSDGQFIVTGSQDQTVKVWDNRGNNLITIAEQNGSINAVAITLNNKSILAASSNGNVRMYDSQSGNFIKEFIKHTSSVNSIAFLTCNKFLTAGNDGMVVLWDQDKGEIVHQFNHGSAINKLTRVTNSLFYASGPGKTKVWTDEHGKWRLLKEFSRESSVVLQGRCCMILRCQENKIFNAFVKKMVDKISHDSYITTAAISPDGSMIITGSQKDNFIYIWSIRAAINDLISKLSLEEIIQIIKKWPSSIQFTQSGQVPQKTSKSRCLLS